ncbi:hypothetical protein QBC33DRAFT_573496 [Phialemonium atrogriseum]|uniref:Uncharacterized protein n=1 Tax=Phialemonium atrogriseum TaxID=1093897 RepID=A0AAJ0FCB0_9PEZI|nr:uncharacterized protein QBC33DRAFT_573496 [Phialemonium atrogriseum]KAK1763406.1 hypothetical protein QBC33DRAFT_573496 [Phialemonium atrogriseum]
MWDAVLDYVRPRGTAIVMPDFSNFVLWDGIKPFSVKAGLQWEMASYMCGTAVLRPGVVRRDLAAASPILDTRKGHKKRLRLLQSPKQVVPIELSAIEFQKALNHLRKDEFTNREDLIRFRPNYLAKHDAVNIYFFNGGILPFESKLEKTML